MEKASSLIEAEGNLGPGTSDEDPIGTDEQSRSTAQRASGVERSHSGAERSHSGAERSHSGFARLDPDRDAGSNEPAGGAGTHQRAPRPIESGVFSGGSGHAPGGQIGANLQNALSSASRGEAELSALHRSLRDASRALTASRHAHESLTEDLRMMHRGLSEVMSEKAAIERYAALLTQERDAALDAAEEARREAKREREFLLREQDRFIQLLLEEHEAEVQQLRRALGLRTGTQVSSSAVQAVGAALAPAAARPAESKPPPATASADDVAPHTSPGIAPPANPPPQQVLAVARDEDDEPTSPRAMGMGARLQLAHASGERHRAIPLPGPAERGAFDKPVLDTQRSESPPPLPAQTEIEERQSTYPPPPAVLDLDSLAHEVDGNSERPPPIRRIGVNEPKLHLRPARVPTQLLDTLVSKTGDEPNRKG